MLRVSPTGVDSGTCEASPCRTMNYAYRQADPGDVVEMAAGTYGYQTLMRQTSKDTATQRVVFRPAAGTRVELAGLGIGGSSYDGLGAWHVEIRDLIIHGWTDVRRATDVTLVNVRLNGTYAAGSKDLSYIGGEWGIDRPSTGTHPEFQVYNRPGNVVPMERLLIDGVHIHHIGRPLGRPDVHTNCLHVWSDNATHRSITVRNSRFDHCDVFSSLISGNVDGLTFENNVFEPSTDSGFQGTAYFSLMLTENVRNVVLRNNSFAMAWVFNRGTLGNAKVVGNLGANEDGCDAQTYSHNVWTTGAVCDPTDRRAGNPGWDSTYRLIAGSPAIDAADPHDFPPTDHDGRPRPYGAAPDAGAFEWAP